MSVISSDEPAMAITSGEAEDVQAPATAGTINTLQSAGVQTKANTNIIASDEFDFASVSMPFIIFF